MSSLLLVITPFALLAIVSSFCFVGCAFQSGGLGGENATVTRYSDDIVLADSDRLLAYWRLNEASGPTAVNARNPGTADGTYLSQVFQEDPPLNSAAAPGTLNFGFPGLLQGDLQPPHDPGSPREPSIFVNGGYVSVDWDPSIAPSEADGFTLEAWVNVGWAEKEPIADRAVVMAIEAVGIYNGFGIVAAKDQTWQGLVGIGGNITYTPGTALVFGSTNHLVVTYAAGQLKLYVNGLPPSAATSATYVPQTAGKLFIGAGGPHLPEPKIPFVGNMQCVALYRGAFTDADVQKHFKNGNGTA